MILHVQKNQARTRFQPMTSALVVQFGQLSYYQLGSGHVVSLYYTHRWWENASEYMKKHIFELRRKM